jgi:hypothetical protein
MHVIPLILRVRGIVLSKIFKRPAVPTNDGDSETSQIEKVHYVKAFELVLSNMEETPSYALTHQLSIGSEIGNIIISDTSVSPRHATFILQQEVVSVIDHGSVNGTHINGIKIEAGKYVILDELDVVTIGDLDVKLKISSVVAPVVEVEPEELPPETPPENPVFEIEKQKEPARKKVSKKVQKKVVSKKRSVLLDPTANSLVRVFAVMSDLLLAYSVLTIFSPFDEFRGALEFIPSTIATFVGSDITGIWEGIAQDLGPAREVVEDLFHFVSSTFQIGSLLIVFFMVRFFSTLLLGVSISEFALGMRAGGNPIWARVGGALRVVLGMITLPLLIFDTPAIISKRTFKEFMTFTNVTLPSKFLAILGIIFFLPLMLALAVTSPLLQGLEAPSPIVVNDRIEQRVKVNLPEGTVPAPLMTDESESLKFTIEYDPKELTIIPNFKFQGSKSKLNLKNSLVFYQRDLQRSVDLEVFKIFDLKQLLGIGMKGNVQLFDKYPEIYNFVYDSMGSNPSFKAKKDEKAQLAFANEFIEFTKTAFSISPNNALDVMQTETVLVKGLIDYKSSFLSLIEYKDFDRIGFIKLGNIIFMKINFNKQKPFDLLIPLIKGEGRIFKVSYDKKDNVDAVSSKFYKFNLDKTNWLSDTKSSPREVMTVLQAFDLFNSGEFQTNLTGAKAQALYAYYFESSKEIMSKADTAELDLWKTKLKNIPRLIEAIPSRPLAEGEEDPKNKLLQNFNDMIDALENNNAEYFGIAQTAIL